MERDEWLNAIHSQMNNKIDDSEKLENNEA
jgi:hypothetical protein